MPYRFLFFPAALLLLGISACYENNIACLDPDATNYDLLADEACPDDCCQYPTLSLDTDRFWGINAFSSVDMFTDGAANRFRLLDFRFYLTDVLLIADPEVLPVPENFIEVGVLAGADTVLTELNTNLALLTSSGGTTATIGRLRTGTRALTQVQASLGFRGDFPAVYPPSAPAASPLATQVGLLNFNDGRGYLQASAQYILTATNDTLRVDVFGDQPLTLDFPEAVAPIRGANLTLELAADYEVAFGSINLAADSTTVVNELASRLPNVLSIIGIR